jgi:hypothetical protein
MHLVFQILVFLQQYIMVKKKKIKKKHIKKILKLQKKKKAEKD